MGNPIRLHITNVWGFLNIGVDRTDKANEYLLLEVGDKVDDATPHSELHWDIWNTIAKKTSATRDPIFVTDEANRLYYAYPLTPALLEILGDHLNSIASLGYKHSYLAALSMQAELPGLN